MSAPALGRVLVVGGRGRTGRRVVERLRTRGLQVRVVSRHAYPEGERGDPGIEDVVGDLADPEPGVLSDVGGVVVSVEPPADAAGADAVLHQGVARLATLAAASSIPVVLVSQIYISRPDAYPAMRDVILARARGEAALRRSGAPYFIVRPGWLHDGPPAGARLEQGDTGDGQVSRDTVADAVVAALLDPSVRSRTFELFDADPSATAPDVDWTSALAGLGPDEPGEPEVPGEAERAR